VSAHSRLDLTEPQQQELHRIVSNMTAEQLNKALGRVWKSLIALIMVIIAQSIYIAFESGGRVQQLATNTGDIQSLISAREVDEAQLAAMNATLAQMQGQLARIENKVDGH
jgi:hypothetical protein